MRVDCARIAFCAAKSFSHLNAAPLFVNVVRFVQDTLLAAAFCLP
jgi:hypothetical protein